jgi:ABC-2 type transport system permease protein
MTGVAMLTPLGAGQHQRPGPRTGWWAAAAAVYAGQMARVRVARGPLLFVATLQSLGILALLRGVIRAPDRTTASAVVAGATVLVVAFVALNLLAQRFGALRAAGALDYYAALPIPASAVVLGAAASYATFTVPGAVITTVAGAAMFGLPMGQIWMVLPVIGCAGVALSGVGAVLGLVMPRAELTTVAGQLGMTAVLFLGVIPPSHLPVAVRALRACVPAALSVDALAAALRGHVDAGATLWRLAATLAIGAAALALAGRLLRRAVRR